MKDDTLRYVKVIARDFTAQIGYYQDGLHIGQFKVKKEGLLQIMSIGLRSNGGIIELWLPYKARKWLYKHLWIAVKQTDSVIVKIYGDGGIRIAAQGCAEAIAMYMPDTKSAQGDTHPT